MLQELVSGVDVDFSPVAVADNFAAEQEHAEQMRSMMEFETQTAADHDRDWAMTFLLAKLPADAYFDLTERRTVRRLAGQVERVSQWHASAIAAEDGAAPVTTGGFATPAEAAWELVRLVLERQAVAAYAA